MYFTYTVPKHIKTKITPGLRVIVPFHGRLIIGIVMRCFDNLSSNANPEEWLGVKIRPIIDVIDKKPLFSKTMFELLMWVSEYYMDPLPNVIKSVVSSRKSIEPDKLRVIEPLNVPDIAALFDEIDDCLSLLILYKHGVMTLERLSALRKDKPSFKALKKMESMGLIKISHLKEKSDSVAQKLFVRLAPKIGRTDPQNIKNAPKQAELFRFVRDQPASSLSRDEIKVKIPGCDGALRALIEKKLLVEGTEEEIEDFEPVPLGEITEKPKLTPHQDEAWKKLEACLDNGFEKVCLCGVTGSGKTELYCLAIEKALRQNKGAIYLIPEISLTPQLVGILNKRFKKTVAVIHSRMGKKRKNEDLDAVFKGKKRLVVGARSAIFAPVKELGIIIVDEEHAPSYKQDNPPRYNARDTAIVRGKIENVPVILGSATPSIETNYNVGDGKYKLVVMTERVEKEALPFVELIDMRGLSSMKALEANEDKKRTELDAAIDEAPYTREEEKAAEPQKTTNNVHTKQRHDNPKGTRVLISDRLHDEVEKRIGTGETSLLFLNQRGFSPVVLCESCGYSFECPNCSVSLTYHHSQKKALCHYCGHIVHVRQGCPACRGPFIEYSGNGTQRVEEETKSLFPQARILRMDSDSMSKHGAHHDAFERIKAGEIDIIIGTQMIAKGLHFPSITLVGVVNADLSLRFPDFRAAERTFQILTQVAGRSGRGENVGEVIVQTYTPEHYSIINAARHDYDTFYENEITLRKVMGYPPFCRMINIVISGGDEPGVHLIANTLFQKLQGQNITILGPTWAPISKMRGRYRRQIIMKSSGHLMRKTLKKAISGIEIKGIPGYVKISVDVDPVNLM